MKITAVTPTRHDPDRLSVFTDGTFACACHVLVWLETGLHVDDEITKEQLERLRDREALRTLRDRALDLLANRPRGAAELARLLTRGTTARPAPPTEWVDQVLQQLREEGLIDDTAFAEYWVEQRDRFRPRGTLALRAELRQKGLDREVIEEALHPDDDLARALRAGEAKARQLAQRAEIDVRTFGTTLGTFLQRRGFTYPVARTAVQQLWQQFGHPGDPDEDPGDDLDPAD